MAKAYSLREIRCKNTKNSHNGKIKFVTPYRTRERLREQEGRK